MNIDKVKQKRTPRVTVVILDFNGGAVTLACVRSFQSCAHENFDVVVVDNGSTDRSVEACDGWPGVSLISTHGNLGYSGGNNFGIRHALANGADYVLIVNNDSEVTNPDFLDALVGHLEENPDVGYVGPKVWFRNRGTIQNTLCGMPDVWKLMYRYPLSKVGVRSRQSGDLTATPEVLNGVCIMLRRAFLEQVGLFDPDIFMYREDTDLAIRARKHGWELSYFPVESIVHLQKAAGYDYLGMVNFLLKRNVVYMYAKHGARLHARVHHIAGMTLCLLRFIRAFFSKKDARAYWTFCMRLRSANRKALEGHTTNSSFGPPASSWNAIRNTTRDQA